MFCAGVESCPIDNRTVTELFNEAEYVFEGAIVSKYWSGYEEFINSQPESNDIVERVLLNDSYTFKALPLKIYKGSNNIPQKIIGGNCNNAIVDGRKKYLIFLFDGGSRSASIDLEYLSQDDMAVLNTANTYEPNSRQ